MVVFIANGTTDLRVECLCKSDWPKNLSPTTNAPNVPRASNLSMPERYLFFKTNLFGGNLAVKLFPIDAV